MDFLIHLDHSLFHFINQTLSSSWQDVFFPFITDLHKQLWFKLIAYPILFGFYIYKYKRIGILYFVFCILSLSFTDISGNILIKKNVGRLRPFETYGLSVIQRSSAHGKSFISNHASNMFAFATYTSAFFPAGRYVFFAAAALIGYSRVYNGVHFPLDVICGALWGISISLIFIFMVKWLVRELHWKTEGSPL
jgi:undecaprenyl-diphosphatase